MNVNLQHHARQELPMTTETITPLRQRMIEDMNARKLCAHTQRCHIHSCKRLAAFPNCSHGSASHSVVPPGVAIRASAPFSAGAGARN